VVLISSLFDIESVLDAYLAVLVEEGTKAEAGERTARAVHAADSREEGAMVEFSVSILFV